MLLCVKERSLDNVKGPIAFERPIRAEDEHVCDSDLKKMGYVSSHFMPSTPELHLCDADHLPDNERTGRQAGTCPL